MRAGHRPTEPKRTQEVTSDPRQRQPHIERKPHPTKGQASARASTIRRVPQEKVVSPVTCLAKCKPHLAADTEEAHSDRRLRDHFQAVELETRNQDRFAKYKNPDITQQKAEIVLLEASAFQREAMFVRERKEANRSSNFSLSGSVRRHGAKASLISRNLPRLYSVARLVAKLFVLPVTEKLENVLPHRGDQVHCTMQ